MVDEPKESTTELLEKQSKLLEVIFEQNKKIKRQLMWMTIGSYIRIALFVIPLIAAAIYLPPLLRDTFKQYESLLGTGDTDTGSPQNFLKQLQK